MMTRNDLVPGAVLRSRRFNNVEIQLTHVRPHTVWYTTDEGFCDSFEIEFVLQNFDPVKDPSPHARNPDARMPVVPRDRIRVLAQESNAEHVTYLLDARALEYTDEALLKFCWSDYPQRGVAVVRGANSVTVRYRV